MSENVADSPIRVFLLIQNGILRDALSRLFRRRADLLVVGSSKQEDCSPQTLIDSQCDVLVLDFLDVQWLPASLHAKPSCSAPKSLLICMDDDFEEFEKAVRGGSTGYLLKEASASDVVCAVRATFRGDAACPPKLCAALFQTLSQTARANEAPPEARRPALTLRQQRLVALIANGLTNKEIASQLSLSHFTVRNHVHRIMKQFSAQSRSQAVHAILSHGYQLEAP